MPVQHKTATQRQTTHTQRGTAESANQLKEYTLKTYQCMIGCAQQVQHMEHRPPSTTIVNVLSKTYSKQLH